METTTTLAVDTNYVLTVIQRDGSNTEIRINGTSEVTGSSGDSTNDEILDLSVGVASGAGDSVHFSWTNYTVIDDDIATNGTELSDMEDCLKNKGGIT